MLRCESNKKKHNKRYPGCRELFDFVIEFSLTGQP
jgi:hypothetical protein